MGEENHRKPGGGLDEQHVPRFEKKGLAELAAGIVADDYENRRGAGGQYEESVFFHYNYFENDRFELEFYREVVNSFNPNAIMEDQETADGYCSIRVNACFNFMKLFNHDIKGIFFYEDTEDYRKNLKNLVRSLQTVVYRYYFWFKDSTDPDMVENAISIASLVDNLYSLITKKAPGFLSDPVRDNYRPALSYGVFYPVYYWCKRYEPQSRVWHTNMLNALAYSCDDFYNKYYEFDHINSFMPLPRNIPYCYCCDAPGRYKMTLFDYIKKTKNSLMKLMSLKCLYTIMTT